MVKNCQSTGLFCYCTGLPSGAKPGDYRSVGSPAARTSRQVRSSAAPTFAVLTSPFSPMKIRPLISAFSLLELLIVLTIIGILAVLGLSLTSRARDNADRAQCSANLRQLHILLLAYTGDHNGRLPPIKSDSVNDRTAHWRRAILPYMGLRAAGEGTTADVFQSKLTCPSLRRTIVKRKGYPDICSFAMNLQLGDPARPLQLGVPLSSIQNAWRKIFATEACIPNGDILPMEELTPDQFTNHPDVWNPHRGLQNVLYADGHIEAIRDIKQLGRPPYSKQSTEDVWTPGA